MAAITSISLTTPRTVPKATNNPPMAQAGRSFCLNQPWKLRFTTWRAVHIRSLRAAPDRISEKVEKSVKDAEETCSDDPKSGECIAAWDEVEELSAAASHARDKEKAGGSDPLENYCKDNPETDECRTYDN